MELRELSRGINVSPLGLGTVKFGRNKGIKYPSGFELPDEKTLADLLALTKDLGINMLDTAPAYGLSEERLGRLLKGQRENWVIVGKAGEFFDADAGPDGTSTQDFSADGVEQSVYDSLKRLQTDYIDVLLLHSDGNDLDILADEDLIARLEMLKQKGVIRAHGASTKTVEGGLKTLDLLDVCMCAYNPLYTQEKPILDKAAELGKGTLIKKALSSGHVDKIAKETTSTDPVQDAFNLVYGHPGTTGIIIGTINSEHLKHNVEAAQKALSLAAAA